MERGIYKKNHLIIYSFLLILAGFALMPGQRVEAVDDTEWQEEYDYTTEGTIIDLNTYNGSDTEIIVPGKAVISGMEYTTRVHGGSDNNRTTWNPETTTKITFESGVYSADDLSYMFSGYKKLEELDISHIITFNVTNMRNMFNGCSSLTSLNLSGLNTSNVQSMEWMFAYCTSLTSLDLSSFDTSKVMDMDEMFEGCSALKTLNLSNFNTSATTGMSYMFYGCRSLTSLDLSGFDTSNVVEMGRMFTNCSSLTDLNVSRFNTSNVTYMRNMFEGCSSLPSLDLSSFDMSKVTNTNYMIYSCPLLKTIKTPVNVSPEVGLNLDTFYYDSYLNFYDDLPANQSTSILLTRAPAPVSGAKITVPDQTYTGKAITPKAKVTFKGKTIPEEGYTLSYKNNVNTGTATITAKFKGNYSGSASGTFQIKEPTVGAQVTTDKAVYQINENKEVTYVAPTNKTTTTITIPDTVKIGTTTYKVTEVNSSAVSNNKNVTTINIGQNVKKLKANTIKKCPKLKKIIFRFKSVKAAKKCKVGKQKKINNKKRLKIKAIIRNRKAKSRKSKAFKKAYRKKLARSFGKKAKISVVYSRK